MKGNLLHLLGLSVEFEINVSTTAERKEQKYSNLVERDTEVTCKISMKGFSSKFELGTIGISGKKKAFI